MKLKPLALAGLLLAGPCAAQAQASSRSPQAADPDAPVPALAYQSAFAGYMNAQRAQPDPSAAPDKAWRQANDTVAGASGHAGHGAGHPPAARADLPPAPAAPAAKPAAPADHSKHQH